MLVDHRRLAPADSIPAFRLLTFRHSIAMVGLLGLLYFPLAHLHLDGYEPVNFLAATRLLNGEAPLLPSGAGGWVGKFGPAGPFVTPHGPATVLLPVPWILLGRLLGFLGVPAAGMIAGQPVREMLAVQMGQAMLTALTALLLLQTLRRLGLAWRPAWVTVVLFALGTIAVPYAISGMESALTVLLFLAFYETLAWSQDGGRGRILAVGLTLGGLCLTKAYVFLLLPGLLAYLILAARARSDWRALRWVGLGCLPGLALASGYNVFRYGDPLVFARLGAYDFTLPNLLNSLYGYALAPSLAVWLYSPPLVLAVFGVRRALNRWPAEMTCGALCTAGLIAAVGPSPFWCSSEWGPRFTMPLVAFWMLAAAPAVESCWSSRRSRGGLAILLVVGLGIQLLGTTYEYTHHYDTFQMAGIRWGEAAVFIPDLSHLRINLLLARAHWHRVTTGEVLSHRFRFRTSPPPWSAAVHAYSRPVTLWPLASPSPWVFYVHRLPGVAAAGFALLATVAGFTALFAYASRRR
jgi:hypothetical protein